MLRRLKDDFMPLKLTNIDYDPTAGGSFRLGMPGVSFEGVKPLLPDEFGISSEIGGMYHCEVEDPYIERLKAEQPGRFEQIQHEEYVFAEMAGANTWPRRKGMAYDTNGNEVKDKSKTVWGDPITRESFSVHLADGGPAHRAWLGKLPHASTLAYLSHPYAETHIKDKDGTLVPIGETLKEWWISCSDGVGIRTRAGIMHNLIEDYVIRNGGGLSTWTSVGCGTAGPVIESAQQLGLGPRMTLVDYDMTALDFAEKVSESLGFKGQIDKLPANIFDTDALRQLPQSQIIDLMGIFEYVGEHLIAMLESRGIKLTEEGFLRANYDILEPGGRLIFGQMRDDRPNPDFTMGVIGWPFIVQRSPKEVVDIVEKAGINPADVNIFLPSDGVYGVYSIDKPI